MSDLFNSSYCTLCNVKSCLIPEKNNLSFIETSALDSTNVETAFQNILTGKCHLTWLYRVAVHGNKLHEATMTISQFLRAQ